MKGLRVGGFSRFWGLGYLGAPQAILFLVVKVFEKVFRSLLLKILTAWLMPQSHTLNPKP